MYKLFRSLEGDSADGSALPSVWPTFDRAGIRFYPGDLVQWVGPPGAGKSTAALNYALAAKVPTLYISMDMGPRLVANRVCAILTGDTTEKVSADILTEAGADRYSSVLQGVDHLYVDYPSRPTPEEIAKLQMAFQEIHGIPSQLMVVDNLMNMNSGQENEWAGFRDLSQAFHYIATELGIVVLLLHHINLGGLDLSYPAPLTSIKGQVSELPATILSFAKREGSLLYCAIKNRHGKSDPSGRSFQSLNYDEARQIISEPIPEAPKRPRTWTVAPPREDWLSRQVKED